MTLPLHPDSIRDLVHALNELSNLLEEALHEHEAASYPPPHPPVTLIDWVTDWIRGHIARPETYDQAHHVADGIIRTLEQLKTLTNPTPSYALTQFLDQFPKEHNPNHREWLAFTHAIRHYIDNLGLLSRCQNVPRLCALWRDIAEGLNQVLR